MRAPDAAGFSLIEAVVAAAIFMAAGSVLFHFAATSQRIARAQPEAADVNQRVRVAAGMIARDLLDAGAADAHGQLGTLTNYFPPILPARTGAQSPDAELTAFPDRISIIYGPAGGWRSELAVDMAGSTADVPINTAAVGCPSSGFCGFVEGTRAAIIDTRNLGAGYDVFSVTTAVAGLGHGPPNPPFTQAYRRSSTAVVPLIQRVYYLDRPNDRLMMYDGFKSTFPLIDNVVDLEFRYFVDPQAASVAVPADTSGNCAYAAGDPPVALLAPLGTASLTAVPLARFTDGPYCGVYPNRFDADLLRIRRVRVRLRVQAAREQSRGRGVDYSNPGTADGELSAVRDFEVTFETTPRNMQPTR